jgi:hypothetical protein
MAFQPLGSEKAHSEPGVVMHTCNPSTQEVESGGYWIQASLARLCLEKKKKGLAW